MQLARLSNVSSYQLLNSKVGDRIIFNATGPSNGFKIVKKQYGAPIGYPSGYYPSISNGWGDLIIIFPGSYSIKKIVKCQ